MIRMCEYTKKSKINFTKLIVKEAFKDDAGRGIVRVDPDIYVELNLRTGDILEIIHPSSNKKTAALLYSGKREDKSTKIIRMDSILRRNLGAFLDDIVEIRKIESRLCTCVLFAGLKEPISLKNEQQLAKKLENRVITKGDILSFYAYGRRIDIVIVDFTPKSDVVRIHQDTKITFSDKSFYEITGKFTSSRRLALNEIILGDKNLKKNPVKAKLHYENALKHFGNKGNGDLFWSLALSYIFLGVKNKDIKYFFKAEEFFKKAKIYYKTQELAIEKNLFELDCLECKIPPYKKTFYKNFTFPNFYTDN